MPASTPGKNLWFFDDIASELKTFTEIELRTAQHDKLKQTLGPLGPQAAVLADVYPNQTNAFIAGAAMAGVNPSAPGLMELAKQEDLERERGYWNPLKAIGNAAENIFQGTVRNGLLLFDSAFEELISRPFRAVVGSIGEQSFLDESGNIRRKNLSLGESYALAGGSTGSKAVGELLSGRPVNIGSGFIPRSTQTEDRPEFAEYRDRGVDVQQSRDLVEKTHGIPISQQAEENQRRLRFGVNAENPQGFSISPGRIFASTITDPGTTQFNVLSGTLDAGLQIYLDPVSRLSLGASKYQKFRRTFGAIDDAHRPAVNIGREFQIPFAKRVVKAGDTTFVDHKTGKTLTEPITVGKRVPLTYKGEQVRIPSPTVESWAKTPRFAALRDEIAATPESNVGFMILRQRFGKKAPVPFLRELSRATDPNVVENLLRNNMGLTNLDQVPKRFAGRMARAKVAGMERFPTLHRLGHDMAGDSIYLYGPEGLQGALNQFDDLMVGAHKSVEIRGKYLRKVANIMDGEESQSKMWDVVREFFETDYLDGTDALSMAAKRKMQKVFDQLYDHRAHAMDETGNGFLHPGAKWDALANGDLVITPSMMTHSEYLHGVIPVPDGRDLRKIFSRWKDHVKDGAITESDMIRALDTGMSSFWKPMVLLRGAWPARVVGEEQIRIAVAGMDSLANHPIRAIKLAMGKSYLSGAGIDARTGQHEMFEVMDAWDAARSHATGGLLGKIRKSKADINWVEKTRANSGYHGWWGKAMRRLHNDELASRLADDPEAAMRWWQSTDAAAIRKEMAGTNPGKAGLISDKEIMREYAEAVNARLHYTAGGQFEVYIKPSGQVLADAETAASARASSEWGNAVARFKERFPGQDYWNDSTQGIPWADEEKARTAFRQFMKQETGADYYEDFVSIVRKQELEKVSKKIRDVDGGWHVTADEVAGLRDESIKYTYKITKPGNSELIDMIATGNVKLETGNIMNIGRLDPTKKEWDKVVRRLKQFDAYGPQSVPGQVSDVGSITSKLDDFVEDAFRVLGQQPTDKLSRSPVFRQSYWDEMIRLIPFMSKNEALKLSYAIEKAALPKTVKRKALERLADLKKSPQIHRVAPPPMVGDLPMDKAFFHGSGVLGPDAENFTRGGLTRDPERATHYDKMRSAWEDRGFGEPDPHVFVFHQDDLAGVDTRGVYRHRRGDVEQYIADDILRVEKIDDPESSQSIRDWGNWLRERLAETKQRNDYGELYDSHEMMDIENLARGLDPGAQEALEYAVERVLGKNVYLDNLSYKTRGVRNEDLWDEAMADATEILRGGADDGFDDVADAMPRIEEIAQEIYDDLIKDPAVTFPAPKVISIDDVADDDLRRILDEFESSYLDEAEEFGQGQVQYGMVYPEGSGSRMFIHNEAVFGPPLKPRAVYTGEQFREIVAANNATKTMGMSIEDMDLAAKGHGIDQTKSLLYDLTRRHEWADITRHIFPFGEAWQEILSTWYKLSTDTVGQTANFARRGQQIVEGARGAGFFSTDPTTGQEMFNYPGAGLLAQFAMGLGGSPALPRGLPGSFDDPLGDDARIEFRGEVGSLNLFTQSFLPGAGPILQIPWSAVGPDSSNSVIDFVDEFIAPFGRQEIDSAGSIIDANLPAWVKKIYTGFAGDDAQGDLSRAYGNTVMDVYKTMILGGAGKDSTQEEAAATLAKAREASRYLFFVRGFLQFFAPAAPIPKFETRVGTDPEAVTDYAPLNDVVPKDDPRDEGGQWLQLQVISSDYRDKLENRFDFDEQATTKWFLETYGFEPYLLTTPKSAVIERRAITNEGMDFERNNSDLFRPDAFPLTAYYAAPDDPLAEFDYQAYLRQIRKGTRVSLTPEQWQMSVNNARGSFQFEKARRQIEDMDVSSSVATTALAWYRLKLKEEYHGYLIVNYGVEQRPRVEQVIEELVNWGSEPRLAESSAGRGLALYLKEREGAMAAAQALGLQPSSFATALQARPIRDYLRRKAEKIYSDPDTRDFGPMWTFVFSNELREDQDRAEILDTSKREPVARG